MDLLGICLLHILIFVFSYFESKHSQNGIAKTALNGRFSMPFYQSPSYGVLALETVCFYRFFFQIFTSG